ncbi:MAG: AVAST type 2 anti-phage system protein Avs2 [Methylococcales bacterium]
MNINFSNIRTHDGSKNSGFEELVCQLAHLQKPENGVRFVKKEGAGGDAGVECYWILDNDSEICWQAKYFPDGMNPSRWQQLDKSFKTALEKHPNLTTYVICMPFDKSDSRKIGRGGNKVVSVENEWQKHVTKWKDAAQKRGQNIDFVYWGKHEITLFLAIDDPLYSGRALYWFNEPILGFDVFKQITHKARKSLGDRYTPEFNIDLPISKSFDGLCLNNHWWNDLGENIEKLGEQKNQFVNAFQKQKPVLLDSEKVNELNDRCIEVFQILSKGLDQRDVMFNAQDVQVLLKEISKYYDYFYNDGHIEKIQDNPEHKTENSIFHSFFGEVRRFSKFLESRKVKAGEIRAALLYGDAGIGKSHLLCDISLYRINSNLPTIFLLGSQYSGGNPVELVKDAVDLKGYRDMQVLGAIDAAGEASGSRALIVIDAINEGLNRDDWHNHLKSFLSDVSRFNNIAILLSCRNTYLRYILPDSINEECLVKIQHFGFQGYEHRAAEKYLSKQGISKPSAPILAPEFTNPLFLKTCCQALKADSQTSFPKGLQGITSLFDFYLGSIEKTIARNKRYTPDEEIIKKALLAFASALFPDYLSGIPKSEARSLINKHDPNVNREDSLFDELLHEGILSEDISYEPEGQGRPVIRFTYERFSDHYIAQQIVEQYSAGTIDDIFSLDQPIGKIISDNGYYRISGIFEALAINIAEKYNKELVDFLPEGSNVEKWQLDEMFSNTVIWRSPDSFSKRTLELLNQIEFYGDNDPALDILLKLATEPNHPWNAELLHKHLIDKEIAERDHFWSIHIAFGDRSEEEEAESIVRTLIEWSCLGDIEDVEDERVRLCAIILLWFLTTPNRRVRDRSTKSLVRILSKYPALLLELICEFNSVNDLYLVERLYAVAYGVICNIHDDQIITDIANVVYELVFKEGKPIPHILLRDYARGVLEFALHNELLSDEVDTDSFRPSYGSEWPLENPTNEEIDELIGDEYTGIKSSLMGFPGDFGNYTMGCVHDWSPTSLSESKPETGYDLKKKFAEKYLHGEVKTEYLEQIKPVQNEGVGARGFLDSFDLESLSSDEYRKSMDQEQKKKEEFDDKVKAQIADETLEYYRWLSGLSDDRPAPFSRKWAQRWVCKRAYEFGWSEKLFSSFEKNCSFGRGGGLNGGAMERIGKKYQWIAFHEFLAHLSDNVHWIDRGYSDIEDKKYYGPWQLHLRDIDPTIWIRKNGEYRSYHNEIKTWWQPYSFSYAGIEEISDQLDYLWDETKVPDFTQLLRINEPDTLTDWTVLRGFWSEKQKKSHTNPDSPRLDCWFRINTIIIRKADYERVEKILKNQNLIDPSTIDIPSTHHQGYLGEYPWHPVSKFMSGWHDIDCSCRDEIPTRHFVPVSEYEWETGSVDFSLDHSLSFYLPAKELVEGLDLKRTLGDCGSWENNRQTIFRDPSIKQYGPSYALMDSQSLNGWLDEDGLEILWLIGGEKQLFAHSARGKFYGRLIYSGLFRLVEGIPNGSSWFERQEPP